MAAGNKYEFMDSWEDYYDPWVTLNRIMLPWKVSCSNFPAQMELRARCCPGALKVTRRCAENSLWRLNDLIWTDMERGLTALFVFTFHWPRCLGPALQTGLVSKSSFNRQVLTISEICSFCLFFFFPLQRVSGEDTKNLPNSIWRWSQQILSLAQRLQT